MNRISAVCFDAFGTLINYSGRQINPYRHLIKNDYSEDSQRKELLTRNVSIEVLANELQRSDILPTILEELNEEVGGLQLYPDVALALSRLRAKGKRVAVCSNLATGYGNAVRRLLPNMKSTLPNSLSLTYAPKPMSL